MPDPGAAGGAGEDRVWRLRALPVGVLPTPRWATTFGAHDTSLQDLGFYVWIVTDGATVGLIDLGLPLDAADAQAISDSNRVFGDGFRDVVLLPELLRSAGLDGADVDFALVTQTVTYHSGGLDAELLPNATFYLARGGVDELLGGPPGHPAPEFYFTERSWRSLRTLAIQGRLRLVDEPVVVVPGVTFEATGGHHPGSAGVRVRTAEGVVGLLETAFLQADLDNGVPIGIAEDVAGCRRAIQRYRAECDHAVALHDLANATRFG
ncbi:hypothetical protein EFK50_12250 [Nocardioides marmoriginsengisoli]|uniref:MBL fold metallo-hydrolase n=1 Tax=Nocardioides marmoriginsengisoli TaxID=661483 RepID=A0A3N0CGF2_9ACTN|nr:hypothetical protein [Nocardioides marmoriginsengisoli]RNL62534.1 hypothetical protein EFK50_12250 [Nocardioides marmoriginsengisoli]